MRPNSSSWTQNHYGPTDWNIVSPPQAGLNGRECRLPRGRFLGGSSGSNGTICVRGVKQDYDDWGFPEWSGDEMFRAMKKVSQPLVLHVPNRNHQSLIQNISRRRHSIPRNGFLTIGPHMAIVVHSISNLQRACFPSPSGSSSPSSLKGFHILLTCSAPERQPTDVVTP